jgi:tetratricopeptide (TPR) repeat protein
MAQPAQEERFYYHGRMKKKLICALGGLWLAAPLLMAQTKDPLIVVPAADLAVASALVTSSALNAELFYQLLVGEISTQNGEPAAGYALILDAARKTGDAQLYQRAADIALQSRSGDAALQAVRAWKQAQPQSREANRYLMQILIALNRISDTAEPLKTEIALAPAAEVSLVITAIPRAYTRVSDKKQAGAVVEEALAAYLVNPATSSVAWTTVGRMRLAAGDAAAALSAVKKAQVADPNAEGPALVAIELVDPKLPEAETLVKTYLARNPKAAPETRMAYSRTLLDAQRYAEATAQLQLVIRDKPELAAAWLILGSLQLQDNQLASAQTSLERYVTLASQQLSEEESARGLSQAYLALAQIAEKRKDFATAEAWIGKIQNSEDMMQAQTRRASILASQGKLAEGRQLIKALPERNPGDARLKLIAEVGLLRDLKQYQMAYSLLDEAIIKFPDEVELVYDQAMMAEKTGNLGDMERLLRRVIAAKPDYYSAYNALGYSLADRNIRLQEARELIRKALTYVPSDPFIQDSLGWVEFRLGNLSEAVKIFEIAFKAKPDPEIAAHFGEVLWTAGQRDRAMVIWREGQLLNPENETLLETLKRFRVKL